MPTLECEVKGFRHSEETKKKIREALRGHRAWNKGLTKKTDERIRKSSKSKLWIVKNFGT